MAALPVHVVFIHGLFSSPKSWAQLRDLIAGDPELELVTTACFSYSSPKFRLRPDRRIPEFSDVADLLSTYLATQATDAERVVLVTHSQGGLIVQRFLDRTLQSHRGEDLVRIKRIVTFACPNLGSQFLLSLRKLAFPWRNPQEQELRPIVRSIAETRRRVELRVVQATGHTATEWHIPITAYAGLEDNIVPTFDAVGVSAREGVVDGDHFSLIRPADRKSSAYRALRSELLLAGEPDEVTADAPAVPISDIIPVQVPAPGAQAVTGRAANDQSAQATDPAGPPAAADAAAERKRPVSVAPPYGRRDTALQGRGPLIGSIRSASQDWRVSILAGLGGMGKSRLALEIAHREQEAGRRVWWVAVQRINSCMQEVASHLGAPDSQVEQAWRGAGSPTDLVWRLLEDCPHKWLLIFDNADNPQDLGPEDGQVSDGTGWLRLPVTRNGMVVVTSRDRNQEVWGAWSRVYSVSPLSEEDGAAMLMNLAQGKGGTFEDARLLARQLGGMPLALRAAAKYVRSVHDAKIWLGRAAIRNFNDYREVVRERFESPPGVRRDLNEPGGTELIQEVCELPLQLLAGRGLTQAAPLIKLFACLSIAAIPYSVLLDSAVLARSALFTEPAARQWMTVLEGLADVGLVDLAHLDKVGDPALAHVLSLHPVVHGVLRDDQDVQHRRSDYYELNVALLLAATRAADPDLPENWLRWGILAPHAVEVARTCLLGDDGQIDRAVIADALELARVTSRYLFWVGLLGPADELVLPVIAQCASFGFDADDREILALRHEKARIALERGDAETAEAELRLVIEARTRVLGEHHPDTLASGHKLAKAVLEQGRWKEAEQLLRSIVDAERNVRGPEHSDTMVVRHSIARAILALGRSSEAEEMMREILAIRSRYWEPTTPETLFARHTLARSLLEQAVASRNDAILQAKATEAEHELTGALSVAAQAGATLPDSLGATADRLDAPAIMRMRQTLAITRLTLGQVSEAEADLERQVDDWARVLGTDHAETQAARNLLARVRNMPSASNANNTDNKDSGPPVPGPPRPRGPADEGRVL